MAELSNPQLMRVAMTRLAAEWPRPLTRDELETLAAWMEDHAGALEDHEPDGDLAVGLGQDNNHLCAGEVCALAFARAVLEGP